MAKTVTDDEILQTIAENYKEIERSIASQLFINVPNHYPTEGSYREVVWKSLFEVVIPKKYCIEQSVFIIDSYGSRSKEADLVIFDEVYTPYIFNYGTIKFIPIEAVVAVIQCKSKKLENTAIREWVNSVDQLTTSLDSVARMAPYMQDNADRSDSKQVTQTATRPIKILCALAKKESIAKYSTVFDILLTADQKRLYKIIPEKERSLSEWNTTLNHATERIKDSDDKAYRESKMFTIDKEKGGRKALLDNLAVSQLTAGGEEENVILSLIFQLNQLLMVLNNPMLFPHHAYAKRFSDVLHQASEKKGEAKDDK